MYIPLGFGTAATTHGTTAMTLPSIPAGAGKAHIQVLTGNIRWRDDGTVPTTAVGMQWAAGLAQTYEGTLDKFKYVPESTTTPEMNVAYYGTHQQST